MMLEIKTSANGGHKNQSSIPRNVPDGWAVVPDGMELPNFPFGEVKAEEIDGVITVTEWIPGTKPEAQPEEEPRATTEELIDIILGVAE